MPEPVLLTVEQVAAMLQVGRSTVYRWIDDREIRSVLFGRNGRRIPRDAVDEWIAAHTQQRHEAPTQIRPPEPRGSAPRSSTRQRAGPPNRSKPGRRAEGVPLAEPWGLPIELDR
jgi:excisionase family DNA binding protein